MARPRIFPKELPDILPERPRWISGWKWTSIKDDSDRDLSGLIERRYATGGLPAVGVCVVEIQYGRMVSIAAETPPSNA